MLDFGVRDGIRYIHGGMIVWQLLNTLTGAQKDLFFERWKNKFGFWERKIVWSKFLSCKYNEVGLIYLYLYLKYSWALFIKIGLIKEFLVIRATGKQGWKMFAKPSSQTGATRRMETCDVFPCLHIINLTVMKNERFNWWSLIKIV